MWYQVDYNMTRRYCPLTSNDAAVGVEIGNQVTSEGYIS